MLFLFVLREYVYKCKVKGRLDLSSFCINALYFIFFTGGNTKHRIQAVPEICKDVQIFCQHFGSLHKGTKTRIFLELL